MSYGVMAVVLFLAVLIGLRIRDDRRNHKLHMQRLRESFGKSRKERKYKEQEYELLTRFFYNNKGDGVVDDGTFLALDMKDLFGRMDQCGSVFGAEQLYSLLRCPRYEDSFDEMELLIGEITENEATRLLLQETFFRMGRRDKIALTDCLLALKENSKREIATDVACLIAAIVSTVLALVWPVKGLGIFLVVMFVNILLYFRGKRSIDPYLKCFGQILRLQRNCEGLGRLSARAKQNGADCLAAYLKELGTAAEKTAGLKRGAFLICAGRSMTGGLSDVVLDYFRMFMHLDLIKYAEMYNTVLSQEKQIRELAEKTGRLDALISVASYRSSLFECCIPEFTREKDDLGIEAIQLYHPLLKDPVSSDIKERGGILITGANASGKSTFLKNVALAAILAQTIHTVPATFYKAPMYHVIASMGISDSLQKGDSYYMAEIKSLKRILEAAGQERPILCVVDEVLRGTNTAERIAASKEILSSLSGRNVLCVAATHDLELTYLLEKEYSNYHFTGEVTDDDIHFSYHLMPGRATDRNAIRLLQLMGYGEDIIEKASKLCGHYLETGNWM